MLVPEWHPQALVLIAWPTAQTDWADTLDDIILCYKHLTAAVSQYTPLLILAHRADDVRQALSDPTWQGRPEHVQIIECLYNDTWTRDYGPIACTDGNDLVLHDFRFNGWGGKFTADLDDAVTRYLVGHGLLRARCIDERDMVLEGGSIDTDGQGTLLTTTQCLLNPNRNPHLTRQQIEAELCQRFHLRRILWVDHGQLPGDDTDAHIDMFARFCSPDTIAYAQCADPHEGQYDELTAMEEQLRTFTTTDGSPYHLIPLPLPHPVYDQHGQQLPATYTNFLITNGAVIYPIYQQPDCDSLARNHLCTAFPTYQLIPIDARALITQRGAIHCATMNIPAGALLRNDEFAVPSRSMNGSAPAHATEGTGSRLAYQEK